MILTASTLCLVFAIHNIYVYLYQMRLNKSLITAFYIALVLMNIADISQWSLELAHPSFYSILFFLRYETIEDIATKYSLWELFNASQVGSTVSNYALNWVVVATIMDLSWTLNVLTGSMQPDVYVKRRKLNFILASCATLIYMLVIIIVPYVFKSRDFYA